MKWFLLVAFLNAEFLCFSQKRFENESGTFSVQLIAKDTVYSADQRIVTLIPSLTSHVKIFKRDNPVPQNERGAFEYRLAQSAIFDENDVAEYRNTFKVCFEIKGLKDSIEIIDIYYIKDRKLKVIPKLINGGNYMSAQNINHIWVAVPSLGEDLLVGIEDILGSWENNIKFLKEDRSDPKYQIKGMKHYVITTDSIKSKSANLTFHTQNKDIFEVKWLLFGDFPVVDFELISGSTKIEQLIGMDALKNLQILIKNQSEALQYKATIEFKIERGNKVLFQQKSNDSELKVWMQKNWNIIRSGDKITVVVSRIQATPKVGTLNTSNNKSFYDIAASKVMIVTVK